MTAPPADRGFHPFYAKYLDADGLPILASARVADEALIAATALLDRMLAGRRDIRLAIVRAGIRVAVMSRDEQTTDIPEHSDLTPKDYWNRRARGLGATMARPATSCGEENLLGMAPDRYRGECILIHEFAHTIHEIGLAAVDPEFDDELAACYRGAMLAGLWKKTYAASNKEEYWAEGVQSWFDANLEASPVNGIHNHVNNREELQAYDPRLTKLIGSVFRERAWRWSDPRRAPKPAEAGGTK